jgi:hypothetical protein
MGARIAASALVLGTLGTLTACASLPNPTSLDTTPSPTSSVAGVPQELQPPGNTTAIKSLTIPDAADCTTNDGSLTYIDVAWTAVGSVQGVTWTKDGSELGDGYDAEGALRLPFVCDGLSHHYGIVVQGDNWPSDYQIADKVVQPGGAS